MLYSIRLMCAAIGRLSSRFLQMAVVYLSVFLNVMRGRTPSGRELLVLLFKALLKR